ncbi:MAG: bifunctional DNA-formamidopyrimidine glycosylase/DNA-(apurinic or apyrimidinic site) lyase [Lentisphaeria bacterium]
MPELPEVETVRCALIPHLTNQVIKAIKVRQPNLRRKVKPQLLEQELGGQTIIAVRRRGKFLVIETDNQRALVIHLGMTGALRIEANYSAEPHKHDHVIWELSSGYSLVFNDARRFGMVSVEKLGEPGGNPPSLAPLGPEPLGDTFSPEYACDKAQNRTQPVKNLLLDQHFVAGIGNIYASEALWRAGISPRRQARNISRKRWGKLVTAVKEVLADAIAAGGTTIRDYRTVDGSEGRFTACLDVYNRNGDACQRCGDSQQIDRIVMAGRATYYCPGCQK